MRDCIIEDNCISSHQGAGETTYESSDSWTCAFRARVPGTLQFEVLDIQDSFHFVYVYTQEFELLDELTGSELNSANRPLVNVGDLVIWEADGFGDGLGWRACLVE